MSQDRVGIALITDSLAGKGISFLTIRDRQGLGREAATAAARCTLKIRTFYNSVEETLFNLGLPLVRRTGQQSFLTYETTSFPGTLAAAATTAYAVFKTIIMALVALGWGRYASAKVSIA